MQNPYNHFLRWLQYFLVNFGNMKSVKLCVLLQKLSSYLYQLELRRYGSLLMKSLLPPPLVFLVISLGSLLVSWFQHISLLDPLWNPTKLTISIQVNSNRPGLKLMLENSDGSQDFKDVRNQLIIEHSLLFIAGFVVFVLACCIFKDQPTVSPIFSNYFLVLIFSFHQVSLVHVFSMWMIHKILNHKKL